MGIEIQTYRVRIGCFKSDRFSFKSVHTTLTRKTTIVMSLVKILVLLSVALIICGDVEVNPGPIGKNNVLQGSLHQGNIVFNPLSRGKQCVCCSVMFIAHNILKPLQSNIWSAADMNKILHMGDYLYQFTRKSFLGEHEYLLLRDIPKVLKIMGTNLSWQVRKTYSGNVKNNFLGEYPLVNMETAFSLSFARCPHAIFVCKGNAVGISKVENDYYVYDSHSRNVSGCMDIDGKSTLIGKNSVSQLCVFLRNMICSLTGVNQSSLNDQYDLHSINMIKVSDKTVKNKKSNGIVTCEIPFDKISKAVDANDMSSYYCSLLSDKHEVQNVSFSVSPGTCMKLTHESGSFSLNLVPVPFLVDVNGSTGNLTHSINTRKRSYTTCSVPVMEERSTVDEVNKNSDCDIVDDFDMKVENGPDYICSSCRQTFFKHSVCQISCVTIPGELKFSCLAGIKSVDKKEWICRYCLSYLKKNKVPPCSIGNKLAFPEMPNELIGLTPLEFRLVSPRIPFMQIKEMPRGGQLGLKGNVVNVPADVNNTVRVLPRNMNDTETIPLKLKRSLCYKSFTAFENVRPQRVIQAAKWLVHNSILFQNEGITLDETWSVKNVDLANNPDFPDVGRPETNDSIEIEGGDHQSINSTDKQCTSEQSVPSRETSEYVEVEDESDNLVSGNMDTIMQPSDYREFNRILSVAPGEGNAPLGMFQDTYAEFLSFPNIYCGQIRLDNSDRETPLHYSTICKWELKNMDRRVANDVSNIFFKLKKLQIKQIIDKVSLAIRKCKMKNKKLTAGDILSNDALRNILKHDEGYKVLRTLRGSPPYWEKAKKDIFSMIRQLGIPTWFCSFSAAETKWLPLLRSLFRSKHDRTCSDGELSSLSWAEKNNLIKSDPVKCARYFEKRFQVFFSDVLKNAINPIGNVKDFFYRVEFQQRGSPHIHMLLWIENAPGFTRYGDDGSSIRQFVDKYTSCHKDDSINDLINYQTHRHGRTCRRQMNSDKCRFGFPIPPLDKTSVLHGLSEDFPGKSTHESNYRKIMELLESFKLSEDIKMTFDEFLSKLSLSRDQYILALRSSIQADKCKLFLNRSVSEIRVNSYNKLLLKAWKANMDLQYILDPYACAAYIVSYVSKGQRGMSNLLSNACAAAREQDNDIREQVRRVGNAFLNHVEVGAQEAVYIILGMPLRRASRDVVFIDTNLPENRITLVKTTTALQELPSSSTDIESDNNLKRYSRRPKSMESYCLVDFVCCFDVKYDFKPAGKPKKAKTGNLLLSSIQNGTGDPPETEYELDYSDDPILSKDSDDDDISSDVISNVEVEEHYGRDGSVIRRRNNTRVYYSIGYSKDADPDNYYRELIMLFLPWRNDSEILGKYICHEDKYGDNSDIIDAKHQQYRASIYLDIEEVAENMQKDWDSLESRNSGNCDTEIENSSMISQYGCFDPCAQTFNTEYDLGSDLGIQRQQITEDSEIICKEMDDLPYRVLIQSLNHKQKMFFLHVLNWFKTKTTPLYTFLTGGAGVGKSLVLKALYQAILKFYNHKVGENPDDMKVLVCAPTGKAAYNVSGNTIHSAFGIPANQGFQYKPLDSQQLNTLQVKYMHLKVVFIDEISMVGRKMFNYINMRLQEIKGSTVPFGGVSIIAFGDLYQLKPVMDSWIFSDSNSDSYDCLASSLWKDLFSCFELTEIMRQKDDYEFAALLNRLREGCHTDSDIDALKGRVLTVETDETTLLPHLYTTRKESCLHNDTIFNKTVSVKDNISAIDSVSGNISADLHEKILSRIPTDASKTKGLLKCLNIAVNLPAELCLNIDVSDGMTNGTPCVVKMLDYRVPNSSRCSIIWVEFEEVNIGKTYRTKYAHLQMPCVLPCWTPILEITRSFSVNFYNSFHVTRRQFPLVMSAAKTVHKSQGSTISAAVVHMGNRKTEHMHYVALSRVRRLSSVFILHLNEKNISVSPDVIEEMCRLRLTRQLSTLTSQFSSENHTFSVIFHNCRSLKKHINDIKCDRNFLAADIIALGETHLKDSDLNTGYVIDEFQTTNSEMNSSSTPSCHGLLAFTRVTSRFRPYECKNLSGVEVVLGESDSCLHTVGSIQFCFLYCSPKIASFEKYKYFFKHLFLYFDPSKPLVVMGDFNVDVSVIQTLPKYILQNYGLRQLVSNATTDYGSILDQLYTNIEPIYINQYGPMESYFSDHKPIFLSLLKHT